MKGEKRKVFVPKEEFDSRRRCFKCQGKGHITIKCPTKRPRAFTLRQYEEMLARRRLCMSLFPKR